MNRLSDDSATERFRAELRQYLTDNHPGRPPKDKAAGLTWQRAWTARLADDGWAMPSWPKESGGMDLPLELQFVYHEEMARARVAAQPSNHIGIVGPTLIRHGSPEQQQRFLPPMIRADELWCQG